ncbi:MAG TPA: dienelactone hydrolase family protein [Candidatus Limnocylindria bacterium]|nr:dienelactone hydrolase family protein [Candidatus Limnocylindria bacterium]
MCHPAGSRPPDVPIDLLPISGGAGGEDVILTSEDASRFRARLAKAGEGDLGVVIAPDVRGLHPFYEELAERFASAGVHAIAIDYFGRTAGTSARGDNFEFREHVAKTKTTTIQADIASAMGHIRGATDARRIFVLGFCMGGRQAFFASAEHAELAGAIGFYGRLSTREGEEGTAPKDRAARMRAPILGLFGGADPGIPASDVEAFEAALKDAGVKRHVVTYPGAPHSFFDRTAAEHKEASEDAWRRALGFIRTGDPASRA